MCGLVDLRSRCPHEFELQKTVDPSPALEEPINLPAERMMDLLVEPCKDWTNKQILDEYLALCDQTVAVLGSMQDEPLASTVIPLSDLGSYPMNQLADAYALQQCCHLRIDLFAPEGPVERRPPILMRPASDRPFVG